jgi:hypothetical protein
MPSLKDRVAALEVHADAGSNRAHDAAYDRIFAALRKALPVVPTTGRAISVYQAGDSFEELITAMHARMQAGALTDDDKRVLALLPAEDMALTNSSPENIVEVLARLFSEY